MSTMLLLFAWSSTFIAWAVAEKARYEAISWGHAHADRCAGQKLEVVVMRARHARMHRRSSERHRMASFMCVGIAIAVLLAWSLLFHVRLFDLVGGAG